MEVEGERFLVLSLNQCDPKFYVCIQMAWVIGNWWGEKNCSLLHALSALVPEEEMKAGAGGIGGWLAGRSADRHDGRGGRHKNPKKKPKKKNVRFIDHVHIHRLRFFTPIHSFPTWSVPFAFSNRRLPPRRPDRSFRHSSTHSHHPKTATQCLRHPSFFSLDRRDEILEAVHVPVGALCHGGAHHHAAVADKGVGGGAGLC